MRDIPPLPLVGALAGTDWPAVTQDTGAQLLAMQFQMDRTQWWSRDQLAAAQDRQLELLVRHAITHVPFYRQHWASIGLDPSRLAGVDFSQLPLLQRADIQNNFTALTSLQIPPGHAPVQTSQTSGSLGMPIRFLVSAVHQFFWDAITLRDHLWHHRDFSAKLAVIRYGIETGSGPSWGGALDAAIRTGPVVALSVKSSTAEQIRWLMAEAPGYLLTYPSILRALAQYCIDHRLHLTFLRAVRSFGEIVPDETRLLVEQAWGVPLVDVYSAQETGYLALQCPDGNGYHVMAENVRLEILDDDGQPCPPGSIGRLVVTPLHNLAMPLIRYANGDYAEVGEPCACGRGLPRLSRIVGRERNLLRRVNGERFWPVIGTADWIGDIPIRQLRLIQRRIGEITFQYVMDRPLEPAEAQRVNQALLSRLPEPFAIVLEKQDALATSPSGKYEEVVCLLETDAKASG